MDSEWFFLVAGALLVTIVIATFIQWPGGSTSLFVSLTFCFIAAVCGSLAFGTLQQWGSKGLATVYWAWFLSLFAITAGTSTLIRYVIGPGLLHLGLLKWYLIPLYIALGFSVYRYHVYYRQYQWQLIALTQGKVVEVTQYPIRGLRHNNNFDKLIFARQFGLYDINRLRPEQYPEADTFDTYEGLPGTISVVFYVPASQKLYRADVALPKRKIEKLTAWQLLYPFYRFQKYQYLEILLSDSGEIAVYLANSAESVRVVNGNAKDITPVHTNDDMFSLYQDFVENERLHSVAAPTEYRHPLLEQDYSVAHKLSGNTEDIVELSAIAANGERYRVPQKYWEGSVLPGKNSVPVILRYLTFNAERKVLEWVYRYAIDDVVKSLESNGINPGEANTDIVYSYHLRYNDEKHARATTYEFINGVKNEIACDISLHVKKDSLD